MAKLSLFSGEAEQVVGFITTCKLYIRMMLREESVEEQVQWILRYMQRGSADIQKENILEDLEAGKIKFESARDFLVELEKKFGGGDNELAKVAELK